jgi:hypothetical protein
MGSPVSALPIVAARSGSKGEAPGKAAVFIPPGVYSVRLDITFDITS